MRKMEMIRKTLIILYNPKDRALTRNSDLAIKYINICPLKTGL